MGIFVEKNSKYLIQVVKGSMRVMIGQELEKFLALMQVLITVETRLVSCYLVSSFKVRTY